MTDINPIFIDLFSLKPRKAVTKRKPARPRDTQRSRVYKCDTVLRAVAAKLPTVAEVERYVAKVWASKRVQDAYPAAFKRWSVPTVKDGRGRRRACATSSYISMPTWARDEAIVLHELAHTIVDRTIGHSKIAGHGWEFCDTYLTLVLYLMGREAHDVLKAAFKANRVRFTKPRVRRELTEEQRAALAERLAGYRAKKAASPD